MVSPLDVIELPGQPGKYARRVIVEAWQAAGSPPVNSAGRLKWDQQQAWDAYQNGTGSPADNPAYPAVYPLAHVRFVALDITATTERVRRLEAVGLVRPYDYEPWHWQLSGNIRQYPLVESLAIGSGSGAVDFTPGEIMPSENWFNGLGQSIIDQIMKPMRELFALVRADVNYVHTVSPDSLKAIRADVNKARADITAARADIGYIHTDSPDSLMAINARLKAVEEALRPKA